MTADIRAAAQRGGRAWHEEMKALGNRGLYRSRTPSEVMDHFHSSYLVNENGCWIWQRSLSAGYAQMQVDGKNWGVHRWSYINFVGEIPPGMFVCHKCDVPACVNPSHLEVGTAAKNTKDAFARGLIKHWNSGKTHCKHGHELPPPNDKGRRVCGVCEFKRVNCSICGIDISRKALRLHERRKHPALMAGLAEGESSGSR